VAFPMTIRNNNVACFPLALRLPWGQPRVTLPLIGLFPPISLMPQI